MEKFLIGFCALMLVVVPLKSFATSGACSYHGGVDCGAGADAYGNAICTDGSSSSVPYNDMEECQSYPQYPVCTTTCCEPSDLSIVESLGAENGQEQYQPGVTQQNIAACQNQINAYQAEVNLYKTEVQQILDSTPAPLPTPTTQQQAGIFTIQTTSLPSGVVGVPYSANISFTYTGTDTPTYSMPGLPSGMALSSLTGSNGNYTITVSGTAGYPDNFNAVLYLNGSSGASVFQQFKLVIAEPNNATPTASTTPTITNLQASNGADPAGTNISSSGTVYMITAHGQKRPYTSAGAFLSYGFNNWAGVVPANSADLALPTASNFIPPRDGKIICSDRGTDKGTCYLITDSKKSAFTSASVFKGLGFSFANTLIGDVSFLPSAPNISSVSQAHPAGVLVNKGGTIYLVGDNGLLGIPDMTTLASWGYSLADSVKANADDSAMAQSGVMATHTAGALSPFGN